MERLLANAAGSLSNVRLAPGNSEAHNGRVQSRPTAARAILLCLLLAALVPPTWSQPSHSTHAAPAPETRMDLNHATLAQLLTVPGMTQSWAARIVRFRPYRTKQDLLERGVVTGEVYQRIKDYLIAHRNAQ